LLNLNDEIHNHLRSKYSALFYYFGA
jgi:hypothetical protein